METLLLERDPELPGLATLTLTRPQKLNAINFRMHDEIQQVCAELQRDTTTRVLILTGAGRAFSAGADLSSGGSNAAPGEKKLAMDALRTPLEERYRAATGSRTCAALEGLDQVTIAAVNGLAIGGAVVFLACMDIRLAAQSAWFSIPEIDLDIPLTWNALPRLMRELGPARTKELVMTCDRFSSDDALRWGLLNHVVPDDELLPRAREMAAKLLAKDPISLALTKTTTRALANQMVPAEATHNDPDYLLLARLLASERSAGKGQGE
jgi:enoyl-CoA hydratase/carnithine racemase